MNVLNDIADERRRQIEVEGWSSTHDDEEHEDGTLASAAACYASPHYHQTVSSGYHPAPGGIPPIGWPWPLKWWKPKNRRRDLIRAGALIVAEIERLDRQVPRHMSNEVPETREARAAALLAQWGGIWEAYRNVIGGGMVDLVDSWLTTAREQGRAEALADVTEREIRAAYRKSHPPHHEQWLSVGYIFGLMETTNFVLASRRLQGELK